VIIDQEDLAERLLAQAKEQGVSLVGPGGAEPAHEVRLGTTSDAELTEHLRHEHGGAPLNDNMRNGTRTEAVLTEIGSVQIEVPRGRDGSFWPVIVPRRNEGTGRGPDWSGGPLNHLTKTVLQAAMNAEPEYLGHEHVGARSDMSPWVRKQPSEWPRECRRC